MASSWVPTASRAFDSRGLGIDTVKPGPGRPWPQHLPRRHSQPIQPSPRLRSGAWTDAISKAANILSLSPTRARAGFSARSGKLPVQPNEPDSSYLLAELVREVYNLQHLPLPDRKYNPLVEHTLLELLHVAVDDHFKKKCGMSVPKRYKAGREKEDSKIVGAAVWFVKERVPRSDATNVPLKRKFDAEKENDGPAQKKLDQKPRSASGSQDSERTNITQYPPQRKRDPFDFGNKVEQALLKMDKWADSWLSGALPQTDLAWDSFEFCLCMPDILEDGEIME